MNLTTLLNSMDYQSIGETKDKEIESLVYHSDDAKSKSVFFAIEGRDTDGEKYISDVISKGCKAIVVSEEYDPKTVQNDYQKDVAFIKVKDVRRSMAQMAAKFFQNPSKDLLTIGITGTKGKSSASYMIWRILEEAGINTGIIGTMFTGYSGNLEEAKNTTPQSVDIQKMLKSMKDAGCKAAVIEVSSQGLMQKRTDFVNFDIGVFTNMSPDHIGEGEHKNYEEYKYWKSCLFKQCKRAVMNLDDEEYKFMLEDSSVERAVFYGKDKRADFIIKDMELWSEKGCLGVKYQLETKKPYEDGLIHDITLELPGDFNSYNGTAAIAVTRMLGVPWNIIKNTLKDIKIPGRAETVDVSKDFTAMVDYAHNGKALESLLSNLKKYKPSRIIVVFGCGGNRDKNRRVEMGKAASELSDIIIVTSDNPRNENPYAIIEDIKDNIKNIDKVLTVPDRREAIGTAIKIAHEGDIVIIAGKGHETYQIIGDNIIHFDDREELLSFRKESE